MILRNDYVELGIVMKFKVDGFDYTILATTETTRCLGLKSKQKQKEKSGRESESDALTDSESDR